MNLFSNLKSQAQSFLDQYKTSNPATYAAAEQAIGALLIADGFLGIDHPFGGKKRSGIFGALFGILLGIILIFVPHYFQGSVDAMSATTTATVVKVGNVTNIGNNNGACSLVVHYVVNGRDYSNQSTISSSSYCSLSEGQTITVNYNPNNPGSWIYGIGTIKLIIQVVFWIGILVIISSIITFIVRLLSIIFGWKLLKDGRKNASNLPPGTNLQTMIAEIKQNFTASVFNFGGAPTVTQPTATQPLQ